MGAPTVRASYMELYNEQCNDLLNPVMLTSLPIIIYPMFDTDVPKEESARSPALYTAGILQFYLEEPAAAKSRFERVLAETKRGFSQLKYSECTSATPRHGSGN